MFGPFQQESLSVGIFLRAHNDTVAVRACLSAADPFRMTRVPHGRRTRAGQSQLWYTKTSQYSDVSLRREHMAKVENSRLEVYSEISD